MKKLCYSAFIAFCSSIVTMLALHGLAADGQQDTKKNESNGGQTYGLEEVAKHASLEDCWMAIEGKIYDITAFIEKHPTPPAVLAPWCGVDATEGMRTKGYGSDHSPAAWGLLPQYYVGDLMQ